MKKDQIYCENAILNKELQGITSKRAGGNGEALKGNGVEGRQRGDKVRLGVLKGGMEGSTGRRGSVKWQWESVKEQWGSVRLGGV